MSQNTLEQEKTYKWIQERLREMSAGKISVSDRQQLEQLAETDPFVADALEGYKTHPDIRHENHLQKLSMRIQPRQRARRRWLIPNLTVTAVAASLMLIIGLWAVMQRLTKENESIAVADQVHEMEIVTDSNSTIISPVTDDDTKTSIAQNAPEQSNPLADIPASTSSRAGKSRTEKPGYGNSTSTTSATSMQKEKADEVAATTQQSEDIAIDGRDAQKQALPKDEALYANQMDPHIMASRITGRVLSTEKIPLSGAHISVRSTNLGAVSDDLGRFELFIPEKESVVDILYSGYADTTLSLRQGMEDVEIILPETIAANTMQAMDGVMGGSTSSKRIIEKFTATPPDQFTPWLQMNTQFPLHEGPSYPKKGVVITFSLDDRGIPIDPRIQQSCGNRNKDVEALRLIRESRGWTCEGNAVPCSGQFTIFYK